MGLVIYRNRKTGELVKAEFPLPVFPTLVAPVTLDGAGLQHLAPVDFANQFEHVLPELPKVDPSTIPEYEVTAGPEGHIHLPVDESAYDVPEEPTPKKP